MSIKEDFEKAKALIKAGHYDEARRILKTINHPTAKEWLAKLDERELRSQLKPPIIKLPSALVWMFHNKTKTLMLVLIVLLIVFGAWLLVSNPISLGDSLTCPSNCADARARGLSPQQAASCGLDSDGDGQACYGS